MWQRVKFGQLIPMRIIEIVATGCQILRQGRGYEKGNGGERKGWEVPQTLLSPRMYGARIVSHRHHLYAPWTVRFICGPSRICVFRSSNTPFATGITSHYYSKLARDALVRTNRRAVVMMFIRMSVRLSVWDGSALTVHVSADLSLWLGILCSGHPDTKASPPTHSRLVHNIL